MGREQITERLTRVFRTVFQDEALRLRDDLKASDVPSWDSFNNVRLVLAMEQEFGFKFSLREINSPQNVGELMDLIVKKLG